MSAEEAFAAALEQWAEITACRELAMSKPTYQTDPEQAIHWNEARGDYIAGGMWAREWTREHEVEPLRQEVERLRAVVQEALAWPDDRRPGNWVIQEDWLLWRESARAALGAQEPLIPYGQLCSCGHTTGCQCGKCPQCAQEPRDG